MFATGDFASLAPPAPSVMPEWSPVAKFGGYGAPYYQRRAAADEKRLHQTACGVLHQHKPVRGLTQLWGSGCDCFAF